MVIFKLYLEKTGQKQELTQMCQKPVFFIISATYFLNKKAQNTVTRLKMYRTNLGGNTEFMYNWKGDGKLNWKADFPFKTAEAPKMYQRSTKKIVTPQDVKSLFLEKIQEYFGL